MTTSGGGEGPGRLSPTQPPPQDCSTTIKLGETLRGTSEGKGPTSSGT